MPEALPTPVFAEALIGGDAAAVNPQRHRPGRKAGRRAGKVAIEVHEADRRDPLAMLDEAIEQPAHWHPAGQFLRIYLGNGARQSAMRDLGLLRDALLLERGIEGVKIRKGWPASQTAIDLPQLASADLVDRSFHSIKNATARNAAQNPERLR